MQREWEPVDRAGKHKRLRTYVFAGTGKTRGRAVLAAMLCAVIACSAWQLISYALDYVSAHQASGKLRGMYYGGAGEPPTPVHSPVPAPTAFPTSPTITDVPAAQPTLQPADTPIPNRLPTVRYPDNPLTRVTERFAALRSEYRDVIGWLTIDGLLDEAVVQRDNIHYMTHDFRGQSNVNGALFLDEFINLISRPYTLIIYGHNMKTGAMFGGLRNYEKLSFYSRSPFITFNTMYEDGRYVIFSVTRLSMDAEDERYFNVDSLDSRFPQRRSEAIRLLQEHSLMDAGVDVRTDDQLLLLLTCVDDEDDRRIVAARRIRPGETEEALLAKTAQAVPKQ